MLTMCPQQVYAPHTYIHTHTHTIFTVIIGVDNPQFCYFIIRERCRSEDRGLKGFSPPSDNTNLCFSHSSFKGLQRIHLSTFGRTGTRSNNRISGGGPLFLGTLLTDSKVIYMCVCVHVLFYCISFLGLHDRLGNLNRHLFSHSSRGQNSQISQHGL